MGSFRTGKRERGQLNAPDSPLCSVFLALAAGLTFVHAPGRVAPPSDDPPLEGDVERVHDPSLARHADAFYVFSTDTGQPGNLPIRRSRDLRRWELLGSVFESVPEWIQEEIPGIRRLWAPDISFFGGKYRVYYSASTFGKNRSIIALATNLTLDPASADYRWVDEGKVFESHSEDDWNAIDPNIFLDEDGSVWMSFGSFWSGIKLRRLDAETGKPSAKDSTLYSLASRPRGEPIRGSVEAPFIIRKDAFYFLFVSFDRCCRGAESTYNIRVGRAERVIGPYADREGVPMLDGGGTLVVESGEEWKGPGGQSVFRDVSGDYLVFHAYHATTGRPSLHLRRIHWAGGWPTVSPLK